MKKESNQSMLLDAKCPLCNKPLATSEYEEAVKKLEHELKTNYDERFRSQKLQFEKQLSELQEKYEKTSAESQKMHQEQLKQLQTDLEKLYQTQAETMKTTYADLLEQNKKQFQEIEKQRKSDYAKELVEKTKLIEQLRKEQDMFKKLARQEAESGFEEKEQSMRQEIQQRDIQIQRFSTEIEHLKKQLIQSQSELKGEAGEIDLYATLTNAFPEDLFRRQKRGISSGDIIQQIRTRAGPIDMPIVYDNKSANQVSKKDIEKARKYKKIHGTNYVLIISANLPKNTVQNGLFGERDGIFLVHPSIVIEIIRQIRAGIVEISKISKTREDRDTKESKLYRYVSSQDFALNLENIHRLNEELYGIQNKEEKDHQVLWKKRRELYERLVDHHNDLSSGIESITQNLFEVSQTSS